MMDEPRLRRNRVVALVVVHVEHARADDDYHVVRIEEQPREIRERRDA